MHSDLAVVEASLADIDADFAAGRYLNARDAAVAAKETLDKIIAGAQGAPYAEPKTTRPVV